jgi:intracellular septation protein A
VATDELDLRDVGDRAPLAVPPLPAVARGAVPQVVDALVPLGLFLTVNVFAGLLVAMLAGVAWSCVAVLRRVVRSRGVPAIVVVAGSLLLLRLTLVVATGSAYLYFLQPTIGTALVAMAFLASTLVGRPLARRFATDFLPLPRDLVRRPYVHRFFVRNSLMWAAIGSCNALLTYVLLVTLSSATFAVTQTMLSITVTTLSVGVSILWFRRAMAHHHTIMFATR